MAKRRPASDEARSGRRKPLDLPPYRSGPVRSLGIPLVYTILLAVMLLEFNHLTQAGISVYAVVAVVVLIIVYLIRELSVYYTVDQERMTALRLFGSRRIPLESIRRIEPVSLRDLSPGGFTGTWGWRSRVWSPTVGKMDCIQTYHRGLLIVGDGVPLFISPRDRTKFIEELSRRVEAVNPAVEVVPEPVPPGGL